MLVITKITNKSQGYTMVDCFSSFELAQAFLDKFCALDSVKNNFHNYDIQSESKVIDAPDYPFLKV